MTSQLGSYEAPRHLRDSFGNRWAARYFYECGAMRIYKEASKCGNRGKVSSEQCNLLSDRGTLGTKSMAERCTGPHISAGSYPCEMAITDLPALPSNHRLSSLGGVRTWPAFSQAWHDGQVCFTAFSR